ncbi:glutamate formimidoyltransferase [Candidatus Caldatribacterium sp.]|uniref:glutamate formimidoyltransferase n=1 Tax=Candidatus Caldatribacterium sp. TaxID=2282143 RepID=UPI002998150A|nr:glutamate formimidoyltransferase [Candidatus Caldatribacterium sp.]MDW8081172.1 glutamate formimidoyltransferase [Candidatus Calescibacterium sp.]
MREVIQSAVNVSTSSAEIIREMVERLRSLQYLKVADFSSDPDHNRSVITLLGCRDALKKAVCTIFEVAEKYLDIRLHKGEHPRIGAVDVVPFTPWRGVTLEDCKTLAWQVGEEIAQRFQVPVYFYGEAARRPERRDLSVVRRGGYEALKEEIATLPERHPDVGPPVVHPTLGATAVGARQVLVAFNVNLRTTDVGVAKSIATRVREGFRAAKAIGVRLQTRNMVQVSVNVLDFRRNTLLEIFEFVKLEARRFGVEVAGAEIVGLVPLEALVDLAGNVLGIPDLRMEQVVEYHLSHFDFF